MNGLGDLLGEAPISVAPAVGHLPDSCLIAFIRVEPNLLLIPAP